MRIPFSLMFLHYTERLTDKFQYVGLLPSMNTALRRFGGGRLFMLSSVQRGIGSLFAASCAKEWEMI